MKNRNGKNSTKRIIAGILFLLFFIPFVLFGIKAKRDLGKSTDIFGDPISEQQVGTEQNQQSEDTAPVLPATEDKAIAPKTETAPAALPKTAFIDVPYTRQAPFSVWDALHEDACEEASLLMVKHFKNGTKIDSKQSIENEIVDLVDFEGKNNYGLSITLYELKEIAAKKYGMKGKVLTDITVNDIKKEIAAGNPVIIGAAGKILPNPYFRNGGPIYHMLVIKGYDETHFITNDPGTMKGDGFRYTFEALFNAIHDWNAENIMQGQKAYLVFK